MPHSKPAIVHAFLRGTLSDAFERCQAIPAGEPGKAIRERCVELELAKAPPAPAADAPRGLRRGGAEAETPPADEPRGGRLRGRAAEPEPAPAPDTPRGLRRGAAEAEAPPADTPRGGRLQRGGDEPASDAPRGRRGGGEVAAAPPPSWVTAQMAAIEPSLFKQRCEYCHTLKREGDALPQVVSPAIPPRWLPHARFDHSAHRPVACAECHKAAASSETEGRPDAVDRDLPRVPPAAGRGPHRLRGMPPVSRQGPGAEPGRALQGPPVARRNWVPEPRSSKIALAMLRRFVAACFIVAAALVVGPLSARAQNCGTTTDVGCLTAADVTNAVQGAATAISPDTMVIAVVDRAGTPLAVFRKAGAPATVTGNFGVAGANANDYAVSLARTGAFFSNDQAPLSSRTVRFISGIHFPPGVTNKPPAALYGIENTNRGCALNPVLDAVVPAGHQRHHRSPLHRRRHRGLRHHHGQGRSLRQQSRPPSMGAACRSSRTAGSPAASA